MGIRAKSRRNMDQERLWARRTMDQNDNRPVAAAKYCQTLHMHKHVSDTSGVHFHIKKCLDWFLKATYKALSYKKKSYWL